MKHKIIILIVFSAILLTNCHNENTSNIEQTDPFHKALNTLYHSSYEYKKKLTEEQYNKTIEMIEFSNYNGDISIQLPKINK